ncbi:hypothetical protein [Mesotoga prima]|uniref:hypothetical protein n=1 Tax=Mesotoga prima TaxID=1184387 RepID=UPI002FD9CCB3
MYQFTLYDLSDASFEAYKKSFETHITEDISKRIGPQLGINISVSFELSSPFMNLVKKIWRIARGDQYLCDVTKSSKEIERMKSDIEKLASIIEDSKLNGNLLPNMILYQTLSRKYIFDSILDYACVLAEIRLKAMEDEFLNVTEAQMLGGFKVRESITKEMSEGNIKHIIGPSSKYLVSGKDVMNLLIERERWYWNDLAEKAYISKQ